MSTDIARIGFGVETSQLEKGVSALSTFSTSAKSANSNAQAIGTAMNKAAVTFAGAVAGMSRSIASLVSATKTATVEEIAAAKEASNFASNIYRVAQAQDTLTVSTQKSTRNLQNMYSAMLKLSSGESILERINRITGVSGLSNKSAEYSAEFFKRSTTKEEWNAMTGSLARDQMPNRFNTANIAAQFQDIAVTAAMGMNPLTVALQQGTQLSAVLNTMERPLEGIAQAFKSIINPVSLISIGLTALVVAGIQMVDWSETADSALNSLSSSFDFVTEHVEGFTVALIGLTAAGVITTFSSLGAVVSNLGKVLGPVITFFTKFIKIIGTALTSKFTIIASVITGLVYGFSKLREYLENTTGFDITFGLWDKLTGLIDKAAEALKNFFSISSKKEEWEALSKGALSNIDDLMTEYYSLSMTEKEADKYLKKMELIKKASEEKIPLENTFGLNGKTGYQLIDELAERYANWNEKIRQTKDNIEEAKKAAEGWDKILKNHEKTVEDLTLKTQTIGLGTYDTTRLQTQLDMLRKLQEVGINKTDIMDESTGQTYLDWVNDTSSKQGRLAEENKKLADSFDFAKDATKSFFSDMREGLRDGQSLWESFGNAVVNVLDKILDKIMDIGVDYLFDALGGMGTKGGETKFSWGNIVSGIGSFFGGGESTSAATPAAAAKGGAFTNGVYSSPTLFKFANGGQFGVMGEAGPEAVMPLRRGPDGSLGVDADGVAGGNVVVNIINNSNAQATVNQRETRQGTEIDVLIDQTVAQKMTQQGSYSNNALNAYSNRRLVMR